MNLRDVLGEAAASLDVSEPETGPEGDATWTRETRPFAIVSIDGRDAEFALDPKVAAAAIRTPDTEPSERGPGWVRFKPAELDQHAIDRASAWFGSAYRHQAPD